LRRKLKVYEIRGCDVSLYDYKISQRIAFEDYPFYGLIMAAMRRADSANLDRLRRAFPQIYEELFARYNAQDGKLPNE